MNIQKNKSFTKKPLLVALAFVVLLGISITYTYYATDIFSDNSVTSSEDSNINLDPPTEQEVKDSQDAKKHILEEDSTDSEEPTGEEKTPEQADKKEATVGISYAGVTGENLEIRAFTPSIIEGTGTCTATLTKSGETAVTESSEAFIDASSTICKPIFVPVSKLSKGTWSVDVSFSSPTHKGSSGPTNVEIR
jgi:cytoskeletal protein RodZ